MIRTVSECLPNALACVSVLARIPPNHWQELALGPGANSAQMLLVLEQPL